MSVSALASERYISLTTHKRDGTTVSTPVWVVSDDGRRLLVWTGSNTGKAKRLRRDSRVLVAPCDARGRPKGDYVSGTARFLEGADSLVTDLLRAKYGWQKRALDAYNLLSRKLRRRPPSSSVYIEIVDPPAA
jgi:PPOX class probable F420-dependent enzyme